MTTFDAADLGERTGLTAGQVGRLFGVTARTANHWSVTGSVPTRYEAQFERVLDVIEGIDVGGPEQVRTALLSSAGGRSLFHQLVDEAPRHERMQFDGVSVRDRIAL